MSGVEEMSATFREDRDVSPGDVGPSIQTALS